MLYTVRKQMYESYIRLYLFQKFTFAPKEYMLVHQKFDVEHQKTLNSIQTLTT